MSPLSLLLSLSMSHFLPLSLLLDFSSTQDLQRIPVVFFPLSTFSLSLILVTCLPKTHLVMPVVCSNNFSGFCCKTNSKWLGTDRVFCYLVPITLPLFHLLFLLDTLRSSTPKLLPPPQSGLHSPFPLHKKCFSWWTFSACPSRSSSKDNSMRLSWTPEVERFRIPPLFCIW